ncbi:hypothetical protein BS47DRAFT_501095 [Hydnum rufescens UP504]|uniref:Uncharacterized protein n=1 Tax=Hydnum rufescens UP504 TaxID=1448309 RepID=A0A9P6B4D2_9AGAM|nr:hypothetical protein BS47DRAFT_501095 [Hydnum rufescens UP504]
MHSDSSPPTGSHEDPVFFKRKRRAVAPDSPNALTSLGTQATDSQSRPLYRVTDLPSINQPAAVPAPALTDFNEPPQVTVDAFLRSVERSEPRNLKSYKRKRGQERRTFISLDVPSSANTTAQGMLPMPMTPTISVRSRASISTIQKCTSAWDPTTSDENGQKSTPRRAKGLDMRSTPPKSRLKHRTIRKWVHVDPKRSGTFPQPSFSMDWGPFEKSLSSASVTMPISSYAPSFPSPSGSTKSGAVARATKTPRQNSSMEGRGFGGSLAFVSLGEHELSLKAVGLGSSIKKRSSTVIPTKTHNLPNLRGASPRPSTPTRPSHSQPLEPLTLTFQQPSVSFRSFGADVQLVPLLSLSDRSSLSPVDGIPLCISTRDIASLDASKSSPEVPTDPNPLQLLRQSSPLPPDDVFLASDRRISTTKAPAPVHNISATDDDSIMSKPFRRFPAHAPSIPSVPSSHTLPSLCTADSSDLAEMRGDAIRHLYAPPRMPLEPVSLSSFSDPHVTSEIHRLIERALAGDEGRQDSTSVSVRKVMRQRPVKPRGSLVREGAETGPRNEGESEPARLEPLSPPLVKRESSSPNNVTSLRLSSAPASRPSVLKTPTLQRTLCVPRVLIPATPSSTHEGETTTNVSESSTLWVPSTPESSPFKIQEVVPPKFGRFEDVFR